MTLPQHYHDAKARHRGMVLLFRRGESYEAYGEDANTLAALLDVSLEQKADKETGEKVYTAAFPQHALENCLRVLLKADHRVAICDQVEDDRPKDTANLIETANKIQPTLFE